MAQLPVGVSHSRPQQAEQHMRPSELDRLPTDGAAQRQQGPAYESSTRRPGHHLRHRVRCFGRVRHEM